MFALSFGIVDGKYSKYARNIGVQTLFGKFSHEPMFALRTFFYQSLLNFYRNVLGFCFFRFRKCDIQNAILEFCIDGIRFHIFRQLK